MTLAGKAQCEGNFDKGRLSVNNQFHSPLNSFFKDVASWAYTHRSLELAAKVSGTQTGACGDILEPDLTAKVGIQVFDGSSQPVRGHRGPAD
jgi:hypothetical protein